MKVSSVKKRSFYLLYLSALLLLCYNVILKRINYSLKTFRPVQQWETKKSTKLSEQAQLHEQYHFESRVRIQSLVNESTYLSWAEPKEGVEFYAFVSLFDVDFGQRKSASDLNNSLKVWSDTTRYFVVDSNICDALLHFQETKSVKRHILLTHFNENWGALSTFVPNRTVDWGELRTHWKNQGCTTEDILDYLNHPNMLGAFTTQFQDLDHPKVHSIPLGLQNTNALRYIISSPPVNKTKLLMVSCSESETRKPQIDAVVSNFRGTVTNSYGAGIDYYEEMLESKFIMCPSGLGWDTYRMWEAFSLGVIPVVERYNRTDGWHRTMDGLPIVWVDTFAKDLTPEFLEREYERLAVNASQYSYEKLTKPWWKKFVNSFLPNGTAIQNMNATPSGNNPTGMTPQTQQEAHSTAADYFQGLQKVAVCDTSKLTFNQSSMIGNVPSPGFIKFDHPKKLGYGPFLTKCGSSSAVSNMEQILDAKRIENLKKFDLEDCTFISFVRHPLDRALAGFHQFEVFIRLGWVNRDIEQHALRWWNTSCIDSSWGTPNRTYTCTGTTPKKDNITRLKRLNAFFGEIGQIGFYDQHIMPLTYQISMNQVVTSRQEKPLFFDLKNMSDVFSSLSRALGKPMQGGLDKKMKRSGTDSDMNWIVQWEDLVTWASRIENEEYLLAKNAIKKLCGLYQNDVECLPYDIPECEKSFFDA